MSCGVEAVNAKFWQAKILLCPSCFELSESLTRAVDKQLARTRDNMMQWQEQHILSGGLLRDPLEVPEVRPPEGSRHREPSSVPEGDAAPRSGLWAAGSVPTLPGEPPRGDQ
jgi:hypothetical protein